MPPQWKDGPASLSLWKAFSKALLKGYSGTLLSGSKSKAFPQGPTIPHAPAGNRLRDDMPAGCTGALAMC